MYIGPHIIPIYLFCGIIKQDGLSLSSVTLASFSLLSKIVIVNNIYVFVNMKDDC